MKKLSLLLSLFIAASTAYAEELVLDVDWNDAKERGQLLAGNVSDGVLTLTSTASAPNGLFLEIPDPGITSSTYALTGMVQYSDVGGTAYLQLDNHFAGEQVFFTKGIAPEGPLAKISGDSDWRPFALPFFSNSDEDSAAAAVPEKLSVSLHLPGSGKVSLRNVILYQYADGEQPVLSGTGGADGRTFGLIGGIAGAILGIWGGLIGTLSGVGRARNFVMGSLNLFAAAGVASLAGGLIGLVSSWPGQGSWLLLLMGVILLASLGLRATVRRRYETLELRKMEAIDAAR